jgi:hypothetical protein
VSPCAPRFPPVPLFGPLGATIVPFARAKLTHSVTLRRPEGSLITQTADWGSYRPQHTHNEPLATLHYASCA